MRSIGADGLGQSATFSRKAFVKGGGALIVGFSLAASARAGGAAADDPYASPGVDQYSIDSWITIHADNTATVKTGGIKQGTGSDTGLLMIAGEELDLDLSQLEFVLADTAVTPDTGKHSASNTIKNAGPGVRAAAASAAQVLLGLASKQLGVPAERLTVSKGVVSGGGRSVTYGELLGGRLFDVRMPASWNMDRPAGIFFFGGIPAGQPPSKPPSRYTLVGTSPPRIEIPSIVTGSEVYIQSIRLPGMLHGRVVRPRGQMVYGFGAPVVSVDEGSISHIPGARVVLKRDFVGVVAPHEYDAIQAAAQLEVEWADPPKALPGHGNELKRMRELDAAGKTVMSRADLGGVAPIGGDVDRALASAAHVVAQTYGWPTNVHTPIGPQCAVADVTPQGARIFSGTQGAYQTRPQIALVLGLPESRVRVTACAMGGCFGDGAQYYDVAQAAALMSQAVGAPVRVQLMRWDEISWGQTSPASLMDVRAGIDAKGNLVAFDFTHFYPQYWSDSVQTNAELAGVPRPATPSSISGNFWPAPMYELPNGRYLLKSIPLEDNWIKVFWLRGGSSPHVTFAGEQAIDELAYAAKMDPVAFRIQNVVRGNDLARGQARDQLLTVLDAVTSASGWKPKVAASTLSDADVVTGRGVAWSNADNTKTYAQTAAVADVTVNRKTGKVRVDHVYQAVSAGLAVYPGGIQNQIVGGVTQILSRLLVEQYRYSRTNATSSDFVTYPILRFKDAPEVTPIVIQRSGDQAEGVGEPVAMAAAAAVANAFFDATGVRMRTAPFTPARVRAALAAGEAGTAGHP
ncbi:MAG TPA: molybdopterin cofactor-binding domain-containing protein [Gaiellaceae bacterium]|nr:molybdopterin cofactor-binding domain-containing protein [Gaiellaceae bacterium]